jgi:hypothetical protein
VINTSTCRCSFGKIILYLIQGWNKSDITGFFFSRFISEIEAVCRQWMADGPRNLLVCFLGCGKFNISIVVNTETNAFLILNDMDS